MAANNKKERDFSIRELESDLSMKNIELEQLRLTLNDEREKRQFYQYVADFTFGWELWFEPSGKIRYCSPSCLDLTGFTANQLVSSLSISEILVYSPDREKFDDFINKSLDQTIINRSLEFRITTRTRQIRWCSMNIRGVFNLQGRYLGIRASIQDITRLKRALGHIHSLSEGRVIEDRTRQRLKTELDIKERELVAFLLQLSQKNELIVYIRQRLRSIMREGTNNAVSKIKKLINTIEKIPATYIDWDMVQMQLDKVHPGFMDRLIMKHPKLSNKERRLCAYLRLGLTSKEIAGLNNLSPQSVEIARVRLRKKLKLEHKIRLANYISQI